MQPVTCNFKLFLRYFNYVNDLVDDVFGSNIFGLGLVGYSNTVAEHIVHHGAYVLRHHVPATADKGVALGSYGQIDATTGRGPKINERFYIGKPKVFGCAGSKDDVEDVFLYLLALHLILHL